MKMSLCRCGLVLVGDNNNKERGREPGKLEWGRGEGGDAMHFRVVANVKRWSNYIIGEALCTHSQRTR